MESKDLKISYLYLNTIKWIGLTDVRSVYSNKITVHD